MRTCGECYWYYEAPLTDGATPTEEDMEWGGRCVYHYEFDENDASITRKFLWEFKQRNQPQCPDGFKEKDDAEESTQASDKVAE